MEALSLADDAQLINYLKGTRCPLGLLVNFGDEKLRYKRFANTKKIAKLYE